MAKDKKQAIEEYKAARKHLAEVSKRDKAETDAYLAANERVAELEKHVPFWRR